MITDLIPVLDAFDRALDGHDDSAYEEYRKGVTLIRKQLWDALTRHGLQRVDAAGKIFDPHVHQAIERVESTRVSRWLYRGCVSGRIHFSRPRPAARDCSRRRSSR